MRGACTGDQMGDIAMTTETEWTPRPFRFEDLNGRPEPESWGPIYPQLPSVEKWRKVDRTRGLTPEEEACYADSITAAIRLLQRQELMGNAGKEPSLRCTVFDAKKHRAKLLTAFHTQCATDKRAWALGQSKDCAGDTIAEAYEKAMDAKYPNRARAHAAGLEAVEEALFPSREEVVDFRPARTRRQFKRAA